MSEKFGYIGGGHLYGLGSRAYVRSFFQAIDRYVFNESLYCKLDWSLITDRLYRRTISDDMLDVAIGTMARMLQLMQYTPLSAVNWNSLGLCSPDERPKIRANANLRDFYLPFETGLVECGSGAKFAALEGAQYEPLRIGLASPAGLFVDGMRPVENYETLGPNDLPFWLRDDEEYPEIPVIKVD